MKIAFAIGAVIISVISYNMYQTEKRKDAEFGKYWKEVASPILEEKRSQCPKEGSARIWCEAEAFNEWHKLLNAKKDELWPK